MSISAGLQGTLMELGSAQPLIAHRLQFEDQLILTSDSRQRPHKLICKERRVVEIDAFIVGVPAVREETFLNVLALTDVDPLAFIEEGVDA